MLSIPALLCVALAYIVIVLVVFGFRISFRHFHTERERPNLCVFPSVSHVQAIVCECCLCCWFDPQFALKIVLFNSTRISSMYELMDALLSFFFSGLGNILSVCLFDVFLAFDFPSCRRKTCISLAVRWFMPRVWLGSTIAMRIIHFECNESNQINGCLSSLSVCGRVRARIFCAAFIFGIFILHTGLFDSFELCIISYVLCWS